MVRNCYEWQHMFTKSKCQEAIENCENDTNVSLTIAKYFMKENSIDKVMYWIKESIKIKNTKWWYVDSLV